MSAVPNNNKMMVSWAEGSGRNLARASNKTGSWVSFVRMLSEPTRTREKRREFDRMTKAEQDELKAVDGWLSGAQCEDKWRSNRTVLPRDLMTLDIDYAEPDLPQRILDGETPISHLEFFTHSSRRHTEEAPRLRLILPMSRRVSRDEYGPLVRVVSWFFDGKRNPIEQVDRVSARPAQMMFRPTVSRDGDWFAFRNKGELMDPDWFLDEYERLVGPWNDLSNLPLFANEEELRERAEEAEDPTQKKGPVGNFCRAYDVERAIEEFLPDVYLESDVESGKPRYTYAGSTSSNGAVVEDDGMFLYSHHGSDPCCEMLVNAFDLVRIHKFGDLDDDPTLPMAKRPSWKNMVDFIGEDAGYQRAQAESQYDITAMFGDHTEAVSEDMSDEELTDLDDILGEGAAAGDATDLFPDLSEDEPADAPAAAKSDRKKRKRPPKGWFPDALDLDHNGKIKSNLPNAATILYNDPRLFGAIAYNELSHRLVIRGDILSKMEIVPNYTVRDTLNGDRWQDRHDIAVRAILEAPNGTGKTGYGMKVTDRDLVGAINLAAERNSFHPVKEYLEELEWDGVERIQTMFPRFIGCEDNTYVRQAAELMMIASVVRIYEPGHKFDNAVIIEGMQGIRKSSFVKALYGETWFGELDCRLDDKQKIAETIQGKWVVELPELSSLNKSDHNDAKAFMRRQYDDVRMAFDRRVTEFPRQCVFWGTTNDDTYLKDPTGNRSYWPVNGHAKTKADPIDTDAVEAERDQLWAEAFFLYRAMRDAQPRGSLYLALDQEAEAIAEDAQEEARTEELHEEWADQIRDWLATPVPLSQLMTEYGLEDDRDMFTDLDDEDIDPDETMVVRTAWRMQDAYELALGLDPIAKNYQHKVTMERALGTLGEWEKGGKSSIRRFGIKARWWVPAVGEGETDETIPGFFEGYVPVSPEGDGSDDDTL